MHLNLIAPEPQVSEKISEIRYMQYIDYVSISRTFSNLYTIHTMDPYKPIDTTQFDRIDRETWGNEYKFYHDQQIQESFRYVGAPDFSYEWMNPYDSKFMNLQHMSRFQDYGDIEALHSILLQHNGTISPFGYTVDTPSSIRLPLKPHQRRTLYEMHMRENSYFRLLKQNMLFLCDNVGSGKSLCMLALIAKSPTVNMWKNIMKIRSTNDLKDMALRSGVALDPSCVEFKSNLIVVPHNVFFQWKGYIVQYTDIPSLYIGSSKDIQNLGISKEQIIEKLNSVTIVLVKSTMFQDFTKHLADYDLQHSTSTKNVVYGHQYNRETGMIEQVDEDSDTVTYRYNPDTHVIVESKELTEFYQVESYLNKVHSQFASKFKKGSVDSINDYIKELEEIRSNMDFERLRINKEYMDCKRLNIISGYVFQRVIFDEADSIKLPSCKHLFGKMTWCITSSMSSLLYPHGKYVRSRSINITDGMRGFTLLKSCMEDIRPEYQNTRMAMYGCIIRNCPEFVMDSMSLPPPEILYQQCYTPSHISALYGNVDAYILRALNAGDIDRAAVEIGCTIRSEMDIIGKACEMYDNQLGVIEEKMNEKKTQLVEFTKEKESFDKETKDREEELEDEEKLERSRVSHNLYSRISYNKKAIVELGDEMKSLQGKIMSIKERISGSSEKSCPICLDTCSKPTLIQCCKNVFCFSCIHQIVNSTHKCPLCRTPSTAQSMDVILDMSKYMRSEKPESNIDEYMDIESYLRDAETLQEKIDVVVSHLMENPKKRFLVFSEFNGTFEVIKRRFDQLNISYSILSGTTAHIQKTIDMYKKNEIQVLLLNALHFGAGLNLQMTDEIIIYHRMNNDLEKQVIGRAQRLGRESRLQIRYMCYENEMPIEEKERVVENEDDNVIVIE